jgi:hypothetical protein
LTARLLRGYLDVHRNLHACSWFDIASFFLAAPSGCACS